MKKLFLATTLAASLLAVSPSRSHAYWNSPQCCGGFGWLGCTVLNWCPSIHYHGPLYNYGPYYGGPGYEYQRIAPEICGAYVPAYQGIGNPYSNWAQAYPYRNGNMGYPAAGPAPSNYYQSFAPPPKPNPTATTGYLGGVTPAYFTTISEVPQR